MTLQNHNIALLKTILSNSNNSQYFKHSHHTKALAIRNGRISINKYKFSKIEFLELLNHLPNINEIDFIKTAYRNEYFEFLLDVDLPHINIIDTGHFERRLSPCYPYDL